MDEHSEGCAEAYLKSRLLINVTVGMEVSEDHNVRATCVIILDLLFCLEELRGKCDETRLWMIRLQR